MHDFGKFVYLDMPKTGSTFVSSFLKACTVCPERRFAKHQWMRQEYDPQVFYFVSIREPIKAYSSLCRYGLDKKGEVFQSLKLAGKDFVYDDFNHFLEYMMDHRNARTIASDYAPELAEEMGFMTWRFLRMSLQYPYKKFKAAVISGETAEDLEKMKITNHEIKNENLREDLLHLAENVLPDCFDLGAARTFLASAKRQNTSLTKSDEISRITPSNHEQIQRKERVLLKRYR